LTPYVIILYIQIEEQVLSRTYYKGSHMKNKSFLIVIALCAGLQGNISFANNNQSWADYFRSKWAQFTSSDTIKVIQEKAKPYVVPMATTVSSVGIGRLIAAKKLTLTIPSMVNPVTIKLLTRQNAEIIRSGGIIGGILALTIYGIVSYYQQKSITKPDAILQIKETLSLLINNQLLYPTRSSKINALLKKDEFLQSITDEYGLVQEACNELIKEINTIPYSQEQQQKDKAVDTKITEVRNMIMHHATLDEQIKALEEQHTTDIPGMEAYLSVYYRLKNKQAVENNLSQEEKASRQTERSELQEARKFLKERAVD
jgi:hypothetical protein